MMRVGTVKFFLADRGFGFVTDNATGDEYFVGSRNVDPCAMPLRGGDLVEFRVIPNRRGPLAVDVRFAV